MKSLLFALSLVFALSVSAQHRHHTPKDTTRTRTGKSKPADQHKHRPHYKDSLMVTMSHSYSLNLPMTRNGSGTGWLPDSSVMYGHGIMTEKWMYMVHWNAFARYNKQDIFEKSNRGDSKFDAPNMIMFMGQRPVGSNGLFHFSSMFSLDPITVGGEGYPLLFQSGETYNNQPLVDRQHPHDLFSELSIGYTHAFSKDIDLTGYFGFPGEPTIGPVAFMHRLSAMNNPDAPLGHHWQDATHITFGVGTIGVRVRNFKLEGSIFTGREPGENRYDFDEPTFDSYATRLSYNPNEFLALQVSQAFITSPERLDPEENIQRTTASVVHQYPLGGENRYVASSIVWGYNNGHAKEHTLLGESNIQFDRTAIYGRYEWVQKSAEELNIDSETQNRIFNIQALTAGANYVILRKFGTNVAAGGQLSVFAAPDLVEHYGEYPMSAEVYIRLYPEVMHMHHHK
jgi:hypothetical protein